MDPETDTVDQKLDTAASKAPVAKPPRKNTAVYVTGLPEDVTISELAEHFGRAGIIMDDLVKGGPRVRIYRDGVGEEGPCKGDALIVYLRPESVPLAITLLDEAPLRPNGDPIRVQEATFDQEPAAQQTQETKHNYPLDRETWKREMARMQRQLEWTDEAAEQDRLLAVQLKNDCICCLYDMFTRDELESDPAFWLDLKEDAAEEAARCGEVLRVYVIEQEEVVAVRFRDREAAAHCARIFQGRYYNGRRIRTSIFDGSFRLKERCAGAKRAKGDDTDDRLERFGDWLEQQE